MTSAGQGVATHSAVAAGWLDVTMQDDLFGRARFLFARRETQA